MIATRVVTDFPLCDQEILLRHLHKTAGTTSRSTKTARPRMARRKTRREGCSECQAARLSSPTWSRSRDWCLPTEPERYAKRLDSTMAEMQEFYDAAIARLEDAIAYCEHVPA